MIGLPLKVLVILTREARSIPSKGSNWWTAPAGPIMGSLQPGKNPAFVPDEIWIPKKQKPAQSRAGFFLLMLI